MTAADPRLRLAGEVEGGADALGVPPGATVALAVSGGPDSMALLFGAAHLVTDGRRRWRLSVAHLDHGLRPDSAADADFVAQAAGELGIPITVRRTDVASLATSERLSVEEAGRLARYRLFAEVAGDEGYIATAHTLDDVAETVLINLLRGSGTAGLAGIPERRGRIIRPLLRSRRDELRTLLDSAGLPYRVDPSNDDTAFLRNRVRHELLPVLESLRPGAVERIGRFSGLAAEDDRFLDELAERELTRRRAADGSIDWRDPPDRALARRVVRLAVGEPAPSAERVDALLEAASGPRGGVEIELGAGRVASVHRRRLRIERK